MFKKLTAATLVLSGLLISSVSHASDSAVELQIESLMANAVNATSLDISYGVQEAVLTANHTIDLDKNEDSYVSTVTITDLDNKTLAFELDNQSAE